MKNKFFAGLLAIVFLTAFLSSCETETKDTPPEIPPYESMAIDFNKFPDNTKSAIDSNSKINFVSAYLTVAVWNTIIGVTLGVPVATFYKSFQNKPVFLENATWQWAYDVNVLGGTYSARMTGQVRSGDIKWEMYVAKAGIGAFPEFKWFEGTSNLDGMGGQWTLYHSYAVQEAVLEIDWEKSGDDIGEITYTYIRESSNGDDNQLSENSYLQYGLTEGVYDAFYNVHFTTRDVEAEGFKDVNIEWSTAEYYGRIKAESYFDNADWHCWDSAGADTQCE